MIFIRVLFAELRRRAGELLGVCPAQCGAVTFVQRFGDALNVNPHFHTLVIDGVYAASENGMPEFHALPPPEDEEVRRVASRVADKILAFVERHASNSEEADPLSSDDPGTAMLLANSIRRNVAVGTNRGMPVSRIRDRIDADLLESYTGRRCAMVSGFNVHANVCIEARDSMRLERLCRYAARPAISTDRLTNLPDGRLPVTDRSASVGPGRKFS